MDGISTIKVCGLYDVGDGAYSVACTLWAVAHIEVGGPGCPVGVVVAFFVALEAILCASRLLPRADSAKWRYCAVGSVQAFGLDWAYA